MEKVGDSSWAEISASKVRLRVELTAEGWSYSVYDLRSKTYLLMPQPASTEEQAQLLAEQWAINARLLDVKSPLKWSRNERE